METWKKRHAGDIDADFKDQLLADRDIAAHLTRDELDAICNLNFHLRYVDQKFKAVGIDP
jgi:hypothetical protein